MNENKTGVTDLVMKSKKVLSNYLMTEECAEMLNEIMSPLYNVINYEVLPVKDRVGDIPKKKYWKVQQIQEGEDKNKMNKKKTRVMDLVMNSKKVLSNYLMTEEC